MSAAAPAHAAGRVDRYTARLHLRAAAGQGVVAGVFLLNEYVARKTLDATRWHVLALLLIPALAQFAAVAWNPADPRRLLGRRPFRVMGTGVHLLLLAPLVVTALRAASPFVVLLALVATAQMLLIPVQNATLAANYSERTRGRRFGAASSMQAATIVLVSWPAGKLLDARPEAWPWLHAIAAVAAVYAYAQWSRLRRRKPPPRPTALADHGSPLAALFRDRTFLAFEACFMLYGIGFLAMLPILPLYLVDELAVTYSQVGLARGLLFWLAFMVAGTLVGRLADRVGLLRVAAASYLMLAFFPLMLLLAGAGSDVGPWFYGAFFVQGVAMSGVHVAWNLGPIALARGRDPLPYLNAHVALVGVRALVGMVGATMLQGVIGSRPVFLGVAAIEVVAAAGMFATAVLSGRRWRVPDDATDSGA